MENSAQDKTKPIGAVVLMLDLTYFQVAEWRLLEWQQAYPSLNVEGELQRMKSWLDANPRRRKTQRGYPRFVTGWLARENAKVEYAAASAKAYARVGSHDSDRQPMHRDAEYIAELEKQFPDFK
jgi:hypothetical protein